MLGAAWIQPFSLSLATLEGFSCGTIDQRQAGPAGEQKNV